MKTLDQVLANPDMSITRLYETVIPRFTSYRPRLKEIADYLSKETETQMLTIMEPVGGKLQEKTYELTRREIILKFANEALQGNLLLVGTNNAFVNVGNPPGWNTRPPGVTDDEFLYVLNRMESWLYLLQAHLFTDEDKYARKVIEELIDWIETCPRPELKNENFQGARSGNSPWRSLEIGIRMFKTWPSVLQYLAGTKFLTEAVLEKYIISVYEHIEVLDKFSAVNFPDAGHNHYLMEMLGLYAGAVAFPELKDQQRLRQFGAEQLERCARVQITPSGGHMEGCPHYHNEVMYYFYLAQIIARQNGETMSQQYKAIMDSGINYSLHTLRPNGRNVPWGDSDSSDSFPVRMGAYAYEAYRDTSHLNGIKSLTDWKTVRKLAMEFLWDSTDLTGFTDYLEQPEADAIDLPLHSFQRDIRTKGYDRKLDLKQICFRNNWSNEALSVFFACRIPQYNEHQHIDPMGFDFTAMGRPILVDPGRFTYNRNVMEVTPTNGNPVKAEFRRIFKEASAHNTLRINDKDPFRYINTWEYQNPPKEIHIGWINDLCKNGMLAADAQLNSYSPHIHKRLVALIDDSFLLIADKVDHLEPDTKIQINYHRDTSRNNIKIENNMIADSSKDVRVAFGSSSNLVPELRDGYVSDLMDSLRNSIIVSYQCKAEDAAKERYFATVLVPYKASAAVPTVGTIKISQTGTESYEKDGQPAVADHIQIEAEVNHKTYQLSWITGKEVTLL